MVLKENPSFIFHSAPIFKSYFMKKIILVFISTFFSVFCFAQNKEANPYKTEATLPWDFETFTISLGNFKERTISVDSLKLLMEEKIKVLSNDSEDKMKVDKFTLSYMRFQENAIVLVGTNDTLTTKMKDLFPRVEKGDVFYIEAHFTKNNFRKSAIMSFKVK